MFDSPLYSFLLAQIFGLYLVIQAVILLSRASYYRALMVSIKETSLAIFAVSSIRLILGIVLVLIHNRWVMGPVVYVTMMCWLVLIKSVLWLAAPERMLALSKKICAGNMYYPIILCAAVAGVLFMVRGFFVFMLWTGAL